MQFSLLIFQHTGHLIPSAFLASAVISSEFEFFTIADDVMHNSAKSVFFEISNNSSVKLIIKFASKLEPISLLALFASILILQTSLIFFNSVHLLFNSSFSKRVQM